MTDSPKIKVLEAIRQGQIGGGETHVLDLVCNLDKETFEPVVLSFTDGPMIDRLNEMGIRNFVIPSTRAFDILQWRKVAKLIRKEKIDIIHVHGSRAASNLLWVAKYLHIPVIYTIHGWSFHDDQKSWIKKIRIKSEQSITRNTVKNISVSLSNQQTGKKYLLGFESVVINNGIDLQKFNPENSYKDIRQELGIDEDAVLIAYIARITIQKDPITLLTAFQQVVKEIPQARLLMVGNGDLKEEAKATALNLGIADNVIFQSFRLDIPDILFASDIYCLPSLWEGLPIGLLEAMAMNNAVVATDVDGSKEVVVAEENGILVPPQDSSTLAEALIRVCRNKDLRNQLQRKARETIEKNYDITAMVKKVESLYGNILIKKQSLVYA